MNPILLGKQVRGCLTDLIRDNFEISSPAFAGMIDRFLSEPKNYLQGPWVTVALPFELSSDASEPFPEIPFRFIPYKHQMDAFGRLCGVNAQSTLIATGTGSGKSECFLYPILDHCRRNAGMPGIKAIIIYPMNALATDQSRRIANLITNHASINNVRCGIYADQEPEYPSSDVERDHVITKRQTMRDDPPDILLTNYKMLDYLLLRAEDRELWNHNQPETLRYLVVDELHSFDGAQAADLALLIRRLKARLKTPLGQLICVGSSATLGTGANVGRQLVSFAKDVFGEEFSDNSIIREKQSPARAFLGGTPDYFEKSDPESLTAALRSAEDRSPPEAARLLARALLGDAFEDELAEMFDKDIDACRGQLGIVLRGQIDTQRVLEQTEKLGKPSSIAEIAEELSSNRRYKNFKQDQREALVEVIISLLTWARTGEEHNRPLLNVRVEYWVRELARLVTAIPDGKPIELKHSDEFNDSERRNHLPIVYCDRCGKAGHLAAYDDKGELTKADYRLLYEGFFSNSLKTRIIYYEDLDGISDKVLLHRKDLKISADQRDKPDDHVEVWIHKPFKQDKKFNRSCPACGTQSILQILGLRAQRQSAAVVSTLFSSLHNEEATHLKPRVLTFSDSVQDAAQRAVVSEIRNAAAVVRKSLYAALPKDGSVSLQSVLHDVPRKLRKELGDENFVSRFIRTDQKWRDEFKELCQQGKLMHGGRLASDVQHRLAWEIFAELTYRSHHHDSLSNRRALVIAPNASAIEPTVANIRSGLRAAGLNQDEIPQTDNLNVIVCGILDEFRRYGGVEQEYLKSAMQNATRTGLNYFAARAQFGSRRLKFMPTFWRANVAPAPPTSRSGIRGLPCIYQSGTTARNWYYDWLDKFFADENALLRVGNQQILEVIIKHLVHDGHLVQHKSNEDRYFFAWLASPDAYLVSGACDAARCNKCGLEDTFPKKHHLPQPCRRFGCRGKLTFASPPRSSNAQRRLLRTSRNHRVFAQEHTGLLDANERRNLEEGFINFDTSWSPNLISATSTLEMGIDIGELSTLILNSVPPEPSNYIQRIGRAGRRDGSALNVTHALSRAHDLQFWEEPAAMISGKVSPPGVFLSAVEVLKRQAAAFSLDCLVSTSDSEIKFGELKSLLNAHDNKSVGTFKDIWFDYLDREGRDIAQVFISLLPPEVQNNREIVDALETWISGSEHNSLQAQVTSLIKQWANYRSDLRAQQRIIDQKRRKLREYRPVPKDISDQITELTNERQEISKRITSTINKLRVLEFLTIRGILPNYAFPEDSVRLEAVISRPKGTAEAKELEFDVREYQRPAAAALSEFAPLQSFYAEGREVEVNRIDLQSVDFSKWRFCRKCSYAKEDSSTLQDCCPNCEDEMWSDTGVGSGSLEVLEMSSVIAAKPAADAPIRERDERIRRRFIRRMFPSFTESDVVRKFVTDHDAEASFAFSFIKNCELREVNFGKSSQENHSGISIAGDIMNAHPFQVCRYCGQFHNDNYAPENPRNHLSRCAVLSTMNQPKDWLKPFVLMRRFTTETLRVMLPASEQSQKTEFKSFAAAMRIGLRHYFEGRIDHLKSEIVFESFPNGKLIRNLYIYDSVPGGTGYLRQIAERETLKEVLSASRDALERCNCINDGCFRCVRSYTSHFGAGTPSRKAASEMVSNLLENWDSINESKEHSIEQGLIETCSTSELETRFLQALSKQYGEACFKHTIKNGKRAWQLAIEEGSSRRVWSLESQVQINQRYPLMPRKRVDFLFTPLDSAQDKPIVVELDGWNYHADEVGSDLETRLAIIRSGHCRVLTLTWSDLSANSAAPLNPLSVESLERPIAENIRKFIKNEKAKHLGIRMSDIKRIVEIEGKGHAWEQFCAMLEEGEPDQRAIASLISLATPEERSLDSIPSADSLPDDSRMLLEETKVQNAVRTSHLTLYLGRPDGSFLEIIKHLDQFCVILHADVPKNAAVLESDNGIWENWRGMWRIINLFQYVDAFHVVHPDSPEISAPELKSANNADSEEDIELLSEFALNVYNKLLAAGAKHPDLIAEDVQIDNRVVGEVELGWSTEQIGLCYSRFKCDGWQLLKIDDCQSRINEAVDFVLHSLAYKTGHYRNE